MGAIGGCFFTDIKFYCNLFGKKMTYTHNNEFARGRVTEVLYNSLRDRGFIKQEEEIMDREFFSLGLNSLDVLSVVIDLEQEFGIELPDEAFDRIATVQSLIDAILE